MKREIELKFFVDGLSEIRNKLRKLKAKKEGVFSEEDFFFDTRQDVLKRKKAVLRLRIGDTRHFLTYKENIKKGKFKIADEYETVVKDPKVLLKVFERLDLKIWFHYKKPKREYWFWKGSHVTLDSFPFGKFVEIEGSPQRIKFLAKKLNLDFVRSSSKSYIMLLKEYYKKMR